MPLALYVYVSYHQELQVRVDGEDLTPAADHWDRAEGSEGFESYEPMFEGERTVASATEFCVLSRTILGAEVVLLRSAGDISVRILDIRTEVRGARTPRASHLSDRKPISDRIAWQGPIVTCGRETFRNSAWTWCSARLVVAGLAACLPPLSASASDAVLSPCNSNFPGACRARRWTDRHSRPCRSSACRVSSIELCADFHSAGVPRALQNPTATRTGARH